MHSMMMGVPVTQKHVEAIFNVNFNTVFFDFSLVHQLVGE
jgi:hypothetical protein